MMQRCLNPRHRRFAEWGGRGITVCAEWRDFPAFYAAMGDRPVGMTLEREDNDKGYEPGNCVWATPAQQVRNRSNARLVTLDGLTMGLKDWCRSLERNYQTVYMRIERGMTPVEALIL